MIKISENWGVRYTTTEDGKLWLAADYYEDRVNDTDGPDWGYGDIGISLGDAMQHVCEAIERDHGREMAMDFCDCFGEKLMFDELPRSLLVWAFKR